MAKKYEKKTNVKGFKLCSTFRPMQNVEKMLLQKVSQLSKYEM